MEVTPRRILLHSSPQPPPLPPPSTPPFQLSKCRTGRVGNGQMTTASNRKMSHPPPSFIFGKYLEVILRKAVISRIALLHELVEAKVVHQPPLQHSVQQMDSVDVVRAHLFALAPLLRYGCERCFGCRICCCSHRHHCCFRDGVG